MNHVLLKVLFNALTCDPTLPCGKWLATHGRVDGIEDTQAIDIRHPVNGDGITEIQHLGIRIGERRRPEVEIETILIHGRRRLIQHGHASLHTRRGKRIRLTRAIPGCDRRRRSPTQVAKSAGQQMGRLW
jgi:hypothetical protein